MYIAGCLLLLSAFYLVGGMYIQAVFWGVVSFIAFAIAKKGKQ